MQAKNQAFAIFPIPLISHYPLPLKMITGLRYGIRLILDLDLDPLILLIQFRIYVSH
jgi:hypothetical protein